MDVSLHVCVCIDYTGNLIKAEGCGIYCRDHTEIKRKVRPTRFVARRSKRMVKETVLDKHGLKCLVH